jgi:hypothetical protein
MRKPCAAAVLAALLWTGDVLAQSPSAIEQARAAVVSDSGLQLALPGATEPPKATTFQIPDWWVLGLVGLGVLFFLYNLRDIIPAWRRRASEEGELAGETGELAAQSPNDILLSADELAREGRYVEAMHILLLKSLGDMRRRLNEQFADSLTSREILRRAALSDAGARALRAIVLSVERSYFGQHPVARADYEACRGWFAELSAALSAGAKP